MVSTTLMSLHVLRKERKLSKQTAFEFKAWQKSKVVPLSLIYMKTKIRARDFLHVRN